MILGLNATANGNYPDANGVDCRGGSYVFGVDGTWDGATAKLQIDTSGGGNWQDVPDHSFTADGAEVVTPGAGTKARMNLALGVLTIWEWFTGDNLEWFTGDDIETHSSVGTTSLTGVLNLVRVQ